MSMTDETIYNRTEFNNEDKRYGLASRSSAPQNQKKFYEYIEEQQAEWEVGMNCTVVDPSDFKLKEAVIKEFIAHKKKAIVNITGYEETMIVNIENLFASQGKGLINRQVLEAEECYKTIDENNKVWETGMVCRAVFEDGNEYEAAITGIIGNIASVTSFGYGEEREIEIDQLKPSKGICEIKLQEGESLYNFTNEGDWVDVDRAEIESEQDVKTEEQSIKPEEHVKIEEQFMKPEGPSIYNIGERPRSTVVKELTNPPFGEFRQPDTEEEALACLMASSHLYSFYKGYYTAMKKFKP